MLPGPRLFLLVLGERQNVGDEHAALAARAQPHVDFIQPPGRGVSGQEVHDPLCEPHEKQLIVDGPRAGGFLALTPGVVQEHQIQIRRITQLDATELAVADRANGDLAALGALAAERRAELCRDLVPGELHGLFDNQLGHFGQAIADAHDRQPTCQVRHRHPEDCRSLELSQRFDLMLGVVLLNVAHSQLELFRKRRTIGQLRQQPRVDELIQEHRVRGDLTREEIPVPTQLDQSGSRRTILVQQRKIRGPLPDRFGDA